MCTIWLYTSFNNFFSLRCFFFTYLVTLVTLAIDLLPHLKQWYFFLCSHITPKFSLLFHQHGFLFLVIPKSTSTLMDGMPSYTSILATHARIHEIFFWNEELLFIQIDLHTLLLIQTQFEFVIVVEVVVKIVHVHLKFHYSIFIQILLFCYSLFFAYCDFSIHQYNKWSTISHQDTYLHSQLWKINPIFFRGAQKNKTKKALKNWLNFWLGNFSS